jgi:AcrR family transcriptional regulator
VSVRDLAVAAAVTVPGLYYHFASKADVIQAVYRARGMGRSVEELSADEAPSAGPVEARIVEQAQREFARLVEDEEFLRLMQRESVLGDSDALEVGRVLGDRWRARWRAVLAGASDVDAAADLDAAAGVIPTFLWGLFVEYLNHHDRAIERRIPGFARLVAPSLRRAG